MLEYNISNLFNFKRSSIVRPPFYLNFSQLY